MEVRYMLKDDKEESVKEVDFVNFYPFNVTVFIRYIRNGRPGEIVLDTERLNYLRVYVD